MARTFRECSVAYENAQLIRHDQELMEREREERIEEIKERSIEILYEAISYLMGSGSMPEVDDDAVRCRIKESLKGVI